MRKVYFISKRLDNMGGVERIVHIIAHKITNYYEVEIVNLQATGKPFFSFNNEIKIIDLSKHLNFRKHSFKLLIKNKQVLLLLQESLRRLIGFAVLKIITANKIKSKFKDAKNDIIVIPKAPDTISILPFLPKRNNIVVRESANVHLYGKKYLSKIKKYYPGRVNTIVVPCDKAKQEYEEIFGGIIKIVKLYNPLEDLVFKTKKRFVKENVISAAGRLDRQKGFDLLIESFSKVAHRYSNWSLKIYGEGYLKDTLQNQIEKLNMSRQIFLMEGTTNLYAELSKSKIFVMSSRFEGYANVLAEALALGVPSISFDWIEGVQELIENDVDGTIVKIADKKNFINYKYINEADIENMSKAIVDLIDDVNKRNMFASAASEKMKKTRNSDLIVNKWIELFEQIKF